MGLLWKILNINILLKIKISRVVIGGDYITTESGTGIVHTAPGHGIDDFNVGKKIESTYYMCC